MTFSPAARTTITDAEVRGALLRTVKVINPLLDAWAADPLGLKQRVPESGTGGGLLGPFADRVSWVLNAADVPGTRAWDDLLAEDRIDWWARRVGAVHTVAVACPGVLGPAGRLLPVQDLLGFFNQALVLCCVARELGMREEQDQALMLGEVLCDRTLSTGSGDAVDTRSQVISCTPRAITEAGWRIAGLFDAVGDELAKRPQPRAPFRYLGMLPGIGFVASYVGEFGALARTAKAGRHWVSRRATT